MRRWWRILFGLLGACLAAAAGWAAAADAPIRVGLLAEAQPFHTWSAGAAQPQGFDIDLLARIAGNTGMRFDYLRYERWDVLLQDLAAGKVNVVTATARTVDREIWMGFTRTYATADQGFAGRRELTSVPSTPDLGGRRLALVKSFATESIAAERFALAPRLIYDTQAQALDAVERGEADFLLGTAAGMRALLAERTGTRVEVLRTFGFAQGQRRLATLQSNIALREKLDAAIGAIDATTFTDWRKRWLERWERSEKGEKSSAATPLVALPAGADTAPLRVGYLPFDRPYTTPGADGQAEGIGIEMMRATAQRAGLAIAAFEPLTLAHGLAALQAGRIDIMLGLTDIAERRRTMRFVGPYRNNPVVLVSRERSPIWSLEQLADRRLAMVEGYFAAGYVQSRHPLIEIVPCQTFDDCMQTMTDGRADAALYGLQGTYARLSVHESAGLRVTGTVPEVSDEHNLGLSLARADLAERLNNALQLTLREDMPRIEREWAARETTLRLDWARVRQGLAAAAALLVLVLLGWWWHSRRLKREIQQTQAARAESDHYLAFMTHEVRNALQSVSGAVALLRGSSRPDSRQLSLLEALGRSSRSTLDLLNGLLDRHRLQAGRMALTLRPESLERCLAAVLDEMRPAAQAKGLTLRFEPEGLAGWWQLDALRLQQIVRNLVVNAVKFTEQGTVTLRASLLDSERRAPWRRLRIEVIDQGPGIDPALLPRLFERFETSGGDRPGTGLGLHLSRDLARAVGGSLEAGPAPGGGACFTLTFDVQPASEPPARRDQVERVLVVEDSPVYGLLLVQAFRNLGASAVLVESVAQARDALIASVAGAGDTAPPFDLVLSDTNLADGRVEELLRFMREGVRPGTSLPPTICISADFANADGERLIAAGAIDLLTKDSDVAAFAQRVLRSFADHQAA